MVHTLELPPETTVEERQARIKAMEDQGYVIKRMYLYWYEGTGEARTIINNGPNMEAFWSGLTFREQLGIAFGHPQMGELQEKYREAARKDYELLGGRREVEGDRETATMVVEFETPKGA